ncbi:hypothetical protein [Parerythrobacter lacustris]|uniref:DUF2848 domain-containing protein n=1 Tax=Parerythrobacter lacustris TaxID=2969984 RepID=A0ABT1XMT0_9SPHN|nr:hypothetical protein [Parerythrobacter lacustris]MCR2832574.1 hypothetical protein [Parerythrobacter lacustris]
MIDVPPEPLPSQERVIEQRLLDCGLNLGGVTVRYADYLQSIEIVIAPAAGATSDNFACIKEASGYEILRFEDSAMFAAYTDFVSELARPEMLMMHEVRLAEAGLWEGFPDRDDFDSLESYARALEAHTGFLPGSALRVSGGAILFESAGAAGMDLYGHYFNLLSVVTYASLRHRIEFGFVGNEKIAK